MKKRTLTNHILEIPFKAKFSHHSATRDKSETIVAVLSNEQGVYGYGESCPRDYVTGETLDSACSTLHLLEKKAPLIQTIEDLKAFCLTSEFAKHPSALCAFELAFIDLLAKEKRMTVEQLLGLQRHDVFDHYTGVLGINRPLKFITKFFFYHFYGFQDYKIKLSGNKKRDLFLVKFVSFFGRKIRLDGNNIFKSSEEAIQYLKPFCPYIWGVEEPIMAKDFKGLKMIADALNIKIILDESFLGEDDFKMIEKNPDLFVPNIRLSKQGGILRSLHLIELLENKNFKWILGSHVGEMSLLTRASLVLAAQNFKGLMAKEGGFGTHLLQFDPFTPNIKIQSGAKIKVEQTEFNYGFNLRYNKDFKKGKK